MPQQLDVRDLAPGFGAEVRGLDPSQPVNDANGELLQRAFDERGILVFRDLAIDGAYQAYLAGVVLGRSVDTGDGQDVDAADAVYVSNTEANGKAPYGRLLFHSDMMWADRPFDVLSLYGVEVAESSVPTIFTSAANAWDTLPPDLRERVAGLEAVHVTGQQRRAGGDDGELLQPQRERVSSTTKPIAYPHPRTGRTLLYVCEMMTQRVEGLDDAESERLLGALFEHLYSDASTWTHEWRSGDLVVWDNLAVQHARPDVALDGPVRTLRKVIAPKPTIAIEKPRYDRAS